eukprot:scaffold144348_cov19-Tisochrysis_lutea.AAC.1
MRPACRSRQVSYERMLRHELQPYLEQQGLQGKNLLTWSNRLEASVQSSEAPNVSWVGQFDFVASDAMPAEMRWSILWHLLPHPP